MYGVMVKYTNGEKQMLCLATENKDRAKFYLKNLKKNKNPDDASEFVLVRIKEVTK